MKRKIIYLVLIVLFAIAVTFFTNGCTSIQVEKAPAAMEQNDLEQESQKETLKDQNGEALMDEKNATSIQPEILKKYVTITINCETIYDNLETFDKTKLEILPEDGLIVPTVKVEIKEDETVFDVLLKVTKGNKIHMEYVSTPLYKSNYIEGIGNIYEIDAGPLSGWMYKVNNHFPNYGCGMYVLKDGDNIEWVYTCDLGRDIGGDWNEQNN
jgi:hypothetical protein